MKGIIAEKKKKGEREKIKSQRKKTQSEGKNPSKRSLRFIRGCTKGETRGI